MSKPNLDVTKPSSLQHSSLNKTSSKIPASKVDATVSILITWQQNFDPVNIVIIHVVSDALIMSSNNYL